MGDFRDFMKEEELAKLYSLRSSWQCYISDPLRHYSLSEDENGDMDKETFQEYVDNFLDVHPHLKFFRKDIEDYVHGWYFNS